MKRIALYFFISIILASTIFAFSTRISSAGVFNSASVLTSAISSIGNTFNVIGSRLSDIAYFMSMQSKYIFGGYKDSNAYQDWDVPKNFDETVNALKTRTQEAFTGNISATTSVTTSNVSIKKTPIAVAKSTTTKSGPLLETNPTLPDISKIFQTNYSTTTISLAPVVTQDTSVSNVKNSTAGSIYGADVLLYTNTERLKNGLTVRLSGDATLDKIAKMRLDDMFAKQYFEHNSPNGDSASVSAKRVGYEYILIGENLALGNFAGALEMVQAWMNSPGHRANILNAEFTKLGVAVGAGEYQGRQVIIGVQVFSRPLAMCTKPDTNMQPLIASSTESIKVAQSKAVIMVSDLEKIKNGTNVDWSYYNQKITEYNYFAKQINDSIEALKAIVDNYNTQVRTFNICIKQ